MESAASYSEMDDEQPTRRVEHTLALSDPMSSRSSAFPSSSVSSVPAATTSSSAVSAWSYQLWCLFRKCVWQLSRQPLITAAAFLLPILCVVIMYLISHAVLSASLPSVVSHDSFSTIVKSCVTQDSYGRPSSFPCTSISYAPSNPATDSIIQRMLAGTALTSIDVSSFPTPYALQLNWAQHVGSQDVAILFGNDTGTLYNVSALNENQYRYTLWYNSSQNNANWRVLSIQFALEQAIANTIITNVVASYPPRQSSLNSSEAFNTSPLPSVTAVPPPSPLTPTSFSYSFLPYLFPPSSAATQYNDQASRYAGAGLLSLGAVIFALLVVQLINAEKQAKLLAMLRMNGMFDSAYWISTLLIWSIIALFASLLATGVGAAYNLQVYANVSFMAHWLSLWLYMVAMIASALFIASLFTKAAWINLVSFLFIALAVGYSVGTTIGSSQFPPLLLELSNTAPFLQFLNGLLPVYHYSKVWYVFSQSSQWQSVSNQTALDALLVNGVPIPNPDTSPAPWPSQPVRISVLQHMEFSDMSRPVMTADGQNCNQLDYACCDYMTSYRYGQLGQVCSTAPPPSTNLGYLVLLTILYTSLAWYASQVGDERAGGKKPWFICMPSYWSSTYARRRPADEVVDGDTQAVERERSRLDQSIRTVKLTKDFKDVTAVKELTLHMDKNECFCLLGHNGAGKTTTINVLTGIYAPTHGEAYVCGLSVREDTGPLHQIIGVCSQDNVLWDNLTVLEHLYILASIRRLLPAVVAAIAEDRLRLVNLWEHRTKKANQLSGGMKRRLCIALAMIGDPRCLFLDEPTTGMDVLHRKEVWDAIRNIKANRVVCLTTHDMQEADALSDRIAVMAEGRLRALGSALFLKNHYGKGYQLKITVAPDDVQQLTDAVEQYLVGSSIVGKEAGAVTIGLKRSQLKNVPLLFKWIDAAVGLAGAELLKEWSISNSTLEEVFLRLCAADTTVNAAVDDAVDNTREDGGIRKCVVCLTRPVNVVTLFTSTGIPVVLPNVMCYPCSFGPLLAEEKAKEENAQRLQEEKEEEKLDRIQWSAIEESNSSPATTALLNPINGSTQSNSNTASASDSSPSSSSERTEDSIGKVAPTSWQQVRSIALKNSAMCWTEKKSWVGRLAILIVMIAMIVLFGSATRAGTSTNQPLNCPQGFASIWWSGSMTCDDEYVRQYLFQGYNYNAVRFSPLDILANGGGYGWWQPTWLQSIDQSATMRQGLQVAVATTATATNPLLKYDIGWGQPAVLNGTSGPNAIRVVDWTPLLQKTGLNVQQQSLDNQRLIVAHTTQSTCPTYRNYNSNSYWTGWVFNGTDSNVTARGMAAWLYPDIVINVKEEKVSGAGDSFLRYELSSYIAEGDYYNNYNYPAFPVVIENPASYYCTLWQPRAPSFPYTASQTIHGLSNAMVYTAIQRHSSYVQQNTNNGTFTWLNSTRPILVGSLLPLTDLNWFSFATASFGIVTSFLVFPSLLLLPWFTNRIIYEREEELYYMMRIAGLRTTNYWLGNYLCDTIISWVWCGSLLVAGYMSGSTMFTSVSAFLWVLLYAVWIHTQLGVAWFVAIFFTRRRVALVILYLLVIVLSAFGFGFAAFLFTAMNGWPWYLNLFPPLTFIRAMSLLAIYQPTVGQALTGEFGAAVNACFWMGSLYMVLAILFHSLRYQTLDQLLSNIAWYRVRRDKAKLDNEAAERDGGDGNGNLGAAFLAVQPSLADEDASVAAERQRVVEQQNGQLSAVSIINLRKSFTSGTKTQLLMKAITSLFSSKGKKADRAVYAVNRLHLGMEYGECFGLLGPNGAGKSTTLSILSGLYGPSSGRALIGGHDVENDLSAVYTLLGVCPQADRVWEDLTVRQHLVFYARLKGVDRKKERALVQKTAEMVTLDGDSFDKKAGTLSGGTRRRLAIAISLIGNPQVWLLDEPTTGLSVEAKREVWDIISKQKAAGRCVVLTSHSMEETDTLADRIGIMCNGELQAIGTPNHLKQMYGDGFKLTLHLSADTDFLIVSGRPLLQQQQQLMSEPVELDESATPVSVTRHLLHFIQDEIYPSAVLSSVSSRQVQFILPYTPGAGSVGASASRSLPAVLSVFDRLDGAKGRLLSEYRIQEWGLANASLEEVFVNIVKQAEDRVVEAEE